MKARCSSQEVHVGFGFLTYGTVDWLLSRANTHLCCFTTLIGAGLEGTDPAQNAPRKGVKSPHRATQRVGETVRSFLVTVGRVKIDSRL